MSNSGRKCKKASQASGALANANIVKVCKTGSIDFVGSMLLLNVRVNEKVFLREQEDDAWCKFGTPQTL